MGLLEAAVDVAESPSVWAALRRCYEVPIVAARAPVKVSASPGIALDKAR
jgi:hypothetical protein